MPDLLEVHPGAYHDSVALMEVSAALQRDDAVETALVAMATDLNLSLLVELGFTSPDAGPGDLIVAVRTVAGTDPVVHVAAALARLAERRPPTGRDGAESPRSLRGAAASHPEASVALVSVPGPSAFVEAMAALEAGLHVVVFSDNVALDEEITLKSEAARRGLLVMGPDCGTVVIAGTGIGFANVVRPGPVSLVAASGTGAQQVCALLDDVGVGTRHVLGTGGRDLTAAVGGITTVAAMRLLDDDPATERIGVIAKAADSSVTGA